MMMSSILSNLLANPIHPKSLKFMANTSKDLITPNDQSNTENFETLSKESTESKKVETPHLKNQKSSQKSSWMKKLTLWSLGLGTALSGIGVSRDIYQSGKTNQAEPLQFVMSLDNLNMSNRQDITYIAYQTDNETWIVFNIEYTAKLKEINFSLQELDTAHNLIKQDYTLQEIAQMKRANTFQQKLLNTAVQQKIKNQLTHLTENSVKHVASYTVNQAHDLSSANDIKTMRQIFTKNEQEAISAIFFGEVPPELQGIKLEMLSVTKYVKNGVSFGLILWDAQNFK